MVGKTGMFMWSEALKWWTLHISKVIIKGARFDGDTLSGSFISLKAPGIAYDRDPPLAPPLQIIPWPALIWTHWYQFGQIWTKSILFWPIWTSLDIFCMIKTYLDLFGPTWTYLDLIWPIHTKLDPIEPIWMHLNPLGTNWTYLDSFGLLLTF